LGVKMNKNIQVAIKHKKSEKSKISLLLASLFGLLLQQAYAAEVNTKVIVTGGLEYSSNPALSGSQKVPVWIYTLAPNLLFDVKSDDNLWYLDGLLTVQRHSNENVLINREDPRLRAGWTHNYESDILGVTASYAESSTLLNQLISSGAFTLTNNTQTTEQLAANWQHTINDRWSALTNAAYTNYSYSIQQNTLLDYSVGEVKSKLIYENNEKLKTSLQADYAQLKPDGVIKSTDNVNLVVGADYKINEHFDVGGDAGVYNLSGRQSETDWTAGMFAGYTVERTKYSFVLNRGISASGIGGFQILDALKLGWVHDRTEKDRFGANFNFNRYKKDVTIGLDGVDYKEVNGYFQHDLSSHWQARVNTTYRKLDTIVTNANETVVGFTIIYDQYGF
jgi:hypothetical protein